MSWHDTNPKYEHKLPPLIFYIYLLVFLFIYLFIYFGWETRQEAWAFITKT